MYRRRLNLTQAQRRELEMLRDNGDKSYLRERAAALVKIADGMAPYIVARQGLLKRRTPNTVYDWLNRYGEQGVEGLKVRPGRGRPSFSP